MAASLDKPSTALLPLETRKRYSPLFNKKPSSNITTMRDTPPTPTPKPRAPAARQHYPRRSDSLSRYSLLTPAPPPLPSSPVTSEAQAAQTQITQACAILIDLHTKAQAEISHLQTQNATLTERIESKIRECLSSKVALHASQKDVTALKLEIEDFRERFKEAERAREVARKVVGFRQDKGGGWRGLVEALAELESVICDEGEVR